MDICLDGDLVWAADFEEGLKLINVTDPTQPYVVTTFNDGGNAKGVHVMNGKIYVADCSDGLEIIQIEGYDYATTDSAANTSFELLFVIIGLSSFLIFKRKISRTKTMRERK